MRCCAGVLAVLAGGLVMGAGHRAAAASSRSATSGYCADAGRTLSGQPGFVGINAFLDDRGAADMRCTLGRMAAGRLGYVRAEISWASVETAPGRYDFSVTDQQMAALAAHRLGWLPVVEDAPAFRTGAGENRDYVGITPPSDPYQYADFVKVLVKRYGAHGSFWRTNPSLPYDPIEAWQVWNEPSLAAYWLPRPNPAAYAKLLHATYRAIKSIDRHALVVLAGNPFVAGISFVRRLYRLGAGRWFDVAAFNDYSSRVSYAEEDLTLLRQMMNAHGGRHTPIWVTEFGWASGGPPSPFTAGRAAPEKVTKLLDFIADRRRALGIDRVFYFNWRDPADISKQLDFWGYHMGLYRSNDKARPVAGVVLRTAARLDPR